MKSTLPDKSFLRGQILLSILIAIAVFSILAHALFTLIASSFELVTFNKARITARHIAQEKLETIKNLPYSEIATIGGIPGGTLIPQEESVQRNGLAYTIKTQVVFIDDPYDGTAPTDVGPEDYKRVTVEVSWEGTAASRRNPIVLTSDVSALARGGIDGGTLVIRVFDANGSPVPQARVIIVADSITPPVNTTINTDSDGKVILPGAKECFECYRISVTKNTSGVTMSTDRTYASSEVTNPLKPHASVYLDQVTQLSFSIDQVGSMTINSLASREDNFAQLGNISFRLHGNKIIGTDAYVQPVYKYDRILTTNSTGSIDLSDMEWDIYHIDIPAPAVKNISGASPLLPLVLTPGGNINFSFATEPFTDNSFFIIVKDSSQNLVASASARLKNGSGFDEEKFTGESGSPDFGQVLFSNLSEETYSLEITAPGYLNFANDYSISGYTKAEVILTPE